MAETIDQLITDEYALFNGDCIPIMEALPDACVDLSIYSPPFATESGGALYHYSSSDRDLSNARTLEEFMEHYVFVVRQVSRLTKPGRMSCVHCMFIPSGNSGCDHYMDFPGMIIKLHQDLDFKLASPPITIWKEPLEVRNRTLTKNLAHKTIVEDSCDCAVAGADFVLVFRKKGQNAVPVTHERGLTRYAGERKIPHELLRYKNWKGSQIENRYSHWIWRQYASSVWDDIRGNTGSSESGVVPFEESRDEADEKHLHPLQLDVIDRCLELWSMPGETILSPFAGVGSEIFAAVRSGRRGIGIELKPSYWRQAVKNVGNAKRETDESQQADLQFEAAGD